MHVLFYIAMGNRENHDYTKLTICRIHMMLSLLTISLSQHQWINIHIEIKYLQNIQEYADLLRFRLNK